VRVVGLFWSRAALQTEILVLRHQLNVLRRKSQKRIVFSNVDRWVFAGLYQLHPNILNALKILRPERRKVPRYLVRDRDGAYGEIFIRRLGAMGIRDRPIAARSPWQNAYTERLIGSIRPECLDHVVVFGERHLRHLLNSYEQYYNEVRTHLSVQKDAPLSRDIRRSGRVLSVPVLGGLHHQYVRV
jgi:hypothetical protein